eukprot:CAMPEP_0115006272 /NCGR_PEP_ID=MMETSP0216-20121206/20395_1 /TAXON_ID=223996 /ORGANISM="Protocruzia adherens, Strain Boccale" /LENGTH=209 /DNA_ID=CAMNT_0002372811 /DNA_START=119 /DNA_END=748 /DNA_ORIENTATION=-
MMTVKPTLILILLTTLVFATHTLPTSFLRSKTSLQTTQTPPDGCITAYAECDYEAASASFCQGEGDFLDILGHRVESVKLGSGDYVYVLCHEHHGCDWAPRDDVECVEEEDEITHFEVMNVGANCVVLFEDVDWTGDGKQVCGDTEDLATVQFDDKAASLLLGRNVEYVLLFENKDYAGRSEAVEENPPDLDEEDFAHELSSLKIVLKS